MTLEQYLLQTPPPRRLRGALINDSPTGANLRWIALFQLFCLVVSPLSYALSEPTRKGLNDFLFILEPPALWLGIWLAACVALLFYSRHLRRRFWLAEQALVLQGTVLDVASETHTIWAGYSMVRLERFTFTVELPDGRICTLTHEGQTPGAMVAQVEPGDPVTVLTHREKVALLGLESLDNSCALLRPRGTYSKKKVLLGCLALICGVGLMLYSVECCVILDSFANALLWPCLGAAVAGCAGLAWLRRRGAFQMATWVVILSGAIFGPMAVLAAFGFANCWLDFTAPEWRPARVVGRRTKSLTHQVPIQVGELTLELDGQRFSYPCRPSRLHTYGDEVQVRVNRGLLGYRWAGNIR